jgi:outer membrane protein assembly factor BamB
MEIVGVKPTVVGNLLYVLTGPLTGEPGLTSETFAAIDCATGATKWTSSARFRADQARTGHRRQRGCHLPPRPGRGRGERLWSSPLRVEGISAHGDRVFVSSGKSAVALDRLTGKEQWRFDDRWPVRFPATIDATTGVVYHGSGDKGGFIYALDGASGKEIWRHKLENTPSLSPLVVAGGSVLYRQLDDKKYGIIRALKAAPKP